MNFDVLVCQTIYKRIRSDLANPSINLYFDKEIFYPSVIIARRYDRAIGWMLKNLLHHMTGDFNSIEKFNETLQSVKLVDLYITELYKACGFMLSESYDRICNNWGDQQTPTQSQIQYLKPNQIKAIQSTISQGFKSGIHHQIMGAGKSFIMLNIVQTHWTIHQIPCVYLLTTDRIEIFVSLFIQSQKEKFESWKSNGIIDMGEFVFIENLINKKFILPVIQSKPIIWVCNNAFLKSGSKYKSIDYSTLGLVLVDEAHSVSGKMNYKMLQFIKSSGCEIIGFSATPLRPVKHAGTQLTNIYGQNGKLNIISNYNMIDGLADGRVLPLSHNLIDKMDWLEVINKYYLENKSLPYSKGVIWVKRIDLLNEYYKEILKIVPNTFRSYSGSNPINQLPEFEVLTSNGLLLCVNRCKEGSDIKNLDCVYLLNPVKKRSIVVALQSFGRVMRVDPQGKKTCGYVYECVDMDTSPELFTMERLLEYYKMIYNLADLTDQIEWADKLVELNKKIKLNPDNSINIELSDQASCTINLSPNIKSQITNWDHFIKSVKQLAETKIIQQTGLDKKSAQTLNKTGPDIYRVAINTNKTMMANYTRTVKNFNPPTWGCKESMNSGLKIGDIILFEIDTTVDIYKVIQVELDEQESTKLWGDSIFKKIIRMEWIKSQQVNKYTQYINELAGYKENYVPRTITIVKNKSKLLDYIKN